eukprot:1155049-Pelagomonas_calceolata.AAC.2
MNDRFYRLHSSPCFAGVCWGFCTKRRLYITDNPPVPPQACLPASSPAEEKTAGPQEEGCAKMSSTPQSEVPRNWGEENPAWYSRQCLPGPESSPWGGREVFPSVHTNDDSLP